MCSLLVQPYSGLLITVLKSSRCHDAPLAVFTCQVISRDPNLLASSVKVCWLNMLSVL